MLNPMRKRLYIYYRVDVAQLSAVVEEVRRLQQRLQNARPSLAVALLRRPEVRDGQITVMETYDAPEGVDSQLQLEIENLFADLARRIGPRRVEVFEDLP